MITLDIPLKSYLKKYLSKKYGSSYRISDRTWLGRYFICLLDKEYCKSKINIKEETHYTIVIPSTIFKEVGFNINEVKLKHLNIMINKVFINDLYSYVDVSIGSDLKFFNKQHESYNKQNRLRAIKQFLSFYDINEDELSPDSIYRAFDRDRKTDKTKKHYKQIA